MIIFWWPQTNGVCLCVCIHFWSKCWNHFLERNLLCSTRLH